MIDDQEIRNRLDGINRYNAYFRKEKDEKGNLLTQHMVGERQLWRIMTKEWGVDPRKFGIKEPAPLPEFRGVEVQKPENLSNDI